MRTDLISLAKEVPNITVSVTLSDLFEFGEELVRTSKRQLEQILNDEAAEKYLTPQKVAELLDCDLSTIWRHDKRGYLKPVFFGAKKRYKLSDIKKILEGGATA